MNERRLEAAVANFLWWGTLTSAIVIGFGMALAFMQGGNTGYPLHQYPATPSAIWHGLLEFRPGAIEALGFGILLLIPTGRILLLSWGYYTRKEYLLMVMSWMVLGVLAAGYLLGVKH